MGDWDLERVVLFVYILLHCCFLDAWRFEMDFGLGKGKDALIAVGVIDF